MSAPDPGGTGWAAGLFGAGRRRWWLAVAIAVIVGGLGMSALAGTVWRASVRRDERQTFASAAGNVTVTLKTMLSRDGDFVATLRSVLTMEPHLTPSAFRTWYARLQGSQRQVGGVGSAVVSVVPARRLAAFQARRDADPVFRALVGSSLVRVKRAGRGSYCLLAAGGAIIGLSPLTLTLVQEDWCDPSSVVGATELPRLRSATDTGQFVSEPVELSWLHTLFLEAAFYRRGAPLTTVAERRAALLGWLVSSFDMPAVVTAALGHNPGLELDLYHANPGERQRFVASAGKAARRGALTQRAHTSIDGAWMVVVHGAPASSGPSADQQGALVFAAGAMSTILLTLLVLALGIGRQRALTMVVEKTDQLRHQALHDALTGLPNRVLALDRAERMLARGRRTHSPVAALYVDIDAFKHINDSFGHPVGDVFLRIVAARLRTVVRESDTAARLSGDEFLVLIDGATLDSGTQLVAERLLEVLREPYDLTEQIGRKLSVTASIGLAYGQQITAEALIANADVALYAAKSTGKNRYAVFESGMETAAQDRMQLELDLADALEADQLYLVYQPIFDLETERPSGVEALLRWRHPDRGTVTPDTFIPIAEGSGLIVAIGRWVLRAACRQAAAWHAAGQRLSMSVNMSARQLDRDDFLDDVACVLEETGLRASVLTIEITETALLRDSEATARCLTALKRLGVRIAIDDFGTGYSSLAYLRQFPIDVLKIDRTFIKSIADSPEAAALIHTLVQLGKTLGLETLGEGIEEQAQLAQLRREHCDLGQGFLLARPVEADGIEDILQAVPPVH